MSRARACFAAFVLLFSASCLASDANVVAYVDPTTPGYIFNMEGMVSARPNIKYIFPTGGPVGGGTRVAIFGERVQNVTFCRFVPVNISINSDFYSVIDHSEVIQSTYGRNVSVWDTVIGDVSTKVPTALSDVFSSYAQVTNVSSIQTRQCISPNRTLESGVFFRNYTTGAYRFEISNDEQFWWAGSSTNFASYVYSDVVFTFYEPPTIHGVWPRGGPREGGTLMRIKGTGLNNFHDSYFTIIRTTSTFTKPLSVSYDELNCTVPVSTSLSGDSLVEIAPNSQDFVSGSTTFYSQTAHANVTTATMFRYYPSPTISSIYPTSGSSRGATTLTVIGTGFDGMLGISDADLGIETDLYGNNVTTASHLLRLQLTPLNTTLTNETVPYSKCSGKGACAGYGQLLWVSQVLSSTKLLFVTHETVDVGLHRVSITLNAENFHTFPALDFRVVGENSSNSQLSVYPFGGKAAWNADTENGTLITIQPVAHTLPPESEVDRTLTFCSFTDNVLGTNYLTPLLTYSQTMVTCRSPATQTSASDTTNDCALAGHPAFTMSTFYPCNRLPFGSTFPRSFVVRLRLNGQDERLATGNYTMYTVASVDGAVVQSPSGGTADGGTTVVFSHDSFKTASDSNHAEDILCTFGPTTVVALAHDAVAGTVTCVSPPAARRTMQQNVTTTITLNNQDYTAPSVFTYYLTFITGFFPPLGTLHTVETTASPNVTAVAYFPNPSPVDVTPSAVTIFGRGFDLFDSALNQTFCYFSDAIKLRATSKTATRVVCEAFVPPAAASYVVTVTLNNQDRLGGVASSSSSASAVTTTSLAFSVFNHTITELSPARCSVLGGCVVAVRTTHAAEALAFTQSLRLLVCLFNTTESPALAVNSTHVLCTAPSSETATNSAVRLRVNGADAVGTLFFEYFQEPSPQLSNVVPSSGPVRGGTVVRCSGVWPLPSDLSLVRCRFGFQEATVVSVSSNLIVCVTPEHSAATVGVSVSLNGQDFSSGFSNFTFFQDPRIDSVFPSIGPATSRTTINVTGIGLSFGADDELFCMFGRFGTTTAYHNPNDPTQLVCDTPLLSELVFDPNLRLKSGETETVSITITLNNQNYFGTSGSSSSSSLASSVEVRSNTFTFYAFTLSSVFPTAAPTNGGHWVRVSGADLTVSGTDDSLVRCQFGCFNNGNGAWTSPGNITHCVGVAGEPGVSVYSRTSLQLYCDTPATTAQSSLPFHLRLNAQGSYLGDVTPTTLNFTFYDQPVATAITPPGGPCGGGNSVVVSGSGFAAWGGVGVSLCRFGDLSSSPTVAVANVSADGSSITCVAPASRVLANGTCSTGDVPVWIALNGVHFLDSGMRYTYYSPTIDAVFPRSVPIMDVAFDITLSGSGFVRLWGQTNDTGLVRCKFGGVGTTTATRITADDTEVHCPTPTNLHSSGQSAVHTTVSLSLNDQVYLSGGDFSFYTQPSISSIHPKGGPVGGGTPVTVTGTGFNALHSLLPGSNIAADHVTSFVVTSPTLVDPPKDTLPFRGLIVNGFYQRSLEVCRGVSYTFDVSNTVHAIYITESSHGGLPTGDETTSAADDAANAAVWGVSGGDTYTGRMTFVPNQHTPQQLYYQSRLYRDMGGQISVLDTCNSTLQILFSSTVPNQFEFVDYATVETFGLGSIVHVDDTAVYVLSAPIHQSNDTSVPVRLTLNNKDFTLPTNSSANLVAAPSRFTFYNNPTVSSVFPPGGPIAGGTVVTVGGAGLDAFGGANISRCLFGTPPQAKQNRWDEDIPSSVYVQQAAADSVVCVTPRFSAPTVVNVHVALNAFDYVTDDHELVVFTLYAPPAIHRVVPRGGELGGNTIVKLFGVGFTTLNAPSLVRCRFGSSVVAASAVFDNMVECVSPNATAAGWVDLAISLNSQDFHAAGKFKYFAAPTLSSLPRVSSSSVSQHVVVDIQGSGFDGAPGWDSVVCVWEGASTVPLFAVGNSSMVSCLSPFAAAFSTTVRVSLNGGQQLSNNSLSYAFFNEPTLSAVNPRSAGKATNTLLKVYGTNLRRSLDGAKCVFRAPLKGSTNVGELTTDVQVFASDDSFVLCSSPVVPANFFWANETATPANASFGMTTFDVHVAVNGKDRSFDQVSLPVVWVAPSNGASDIFPRGAPNHVGTLLRLWAQSLTDLLEFVVASANTTTTTSGGASAWDAVQSVLGSDIVCYFLDDATGWVWTTPVQNITWMTPNAESAAWLPPNMPQQLVVSCPAPVTTKTGNVSVQVSLNGVDPIEGLGHWLMLYTSPVLNLLSPSGGMWGGNTLVNITGSGLEPMANSFADSRCRFGDSASGVVPFVQAPLTVVDTGSGNVVVQCMSPPSSATSAVFPVSSAITTVPLSVSLNGVDFDVVATLDYSYFSFTLSGKLSPQAGPRVGGSVTVVHGTTLDVFGSATGSNLGGVKCRFGTVEVLASNITATNLTCVTPAQTAAGFVNVSVTLNDQQYVSVSGQGQAPFTYTTTGTSNGTSTANSTANSNATAISSGAAAVFTTYAFYDHPVWANVLPLGGHKSGNTSVTISGQGFFPFSLPLSSRCRFGDDVVDVATLSDTRVTCFTGQKPDATGTYAVEIALNGQDYHASAVYLYEFYDPPNITAITPVVGPTSGGTNVTMSGKNFFAFRNGTATCSFGEAVLIDGVARQALVSAHVVSDDMLWCVTPSGLNQGLVDVSLSLNNGVDFVDKSLPFVYSCVHMNNNRASCITDETCAYCDSGEYTIPTANQGMCQSCRYFGAQYQPNESGCQTGPLTTTSTELGQLAGNSALDSALPMSSCNRLVYSHTVDPGCCGISVNHTVRPNLFVYLRVVPRHTHNQIHVWVKNTEGDTTRLYTKKLSPPTASDYDKTSARTTPPHRLTIEKHELTCAQGKAPNCDPWFIGVSGSPVDVRRDNRFNIELTADEHNQAITFNVFISVEFNYTHFGFHECEGSASFPTCGLAMNGASSLVRTERGARVMRLVASDSSPTAAPTAGSVWYDTALYLAEGFDSQFEFQITSPSLCVAPLEYFLNTHTTDIRKTNYNVDAYTGLSSFDTSPEQFTDGGHVNMTADMFSISPVHKSNLPYMSSDLGDTVCASNQGWGGEGFAFVIQSSPLSTRAIGCEGTGVGFAPNPSSGCTKTITNSLAIEFDSYFNVTKHELRGRADHPNVSISYDFSFLNTVSVFSNGTNNHDDPLTSRQIHPLREVMLFDGAIHSVLVRYLAPTTGLDGYLFVYLDGLESQQPLISIEGIDLQQMGLLDSNGRAYMGFTASTGLASQNQDILSWSFCQLPGCATY